MGLLTHNTVVYDTIVNQNLMTILRSLKNKKRAESWWFSKIKFKVPNAKIVLNYTIWSCKTDLVISA